MCAFHTIIPTMELIYLIANLCLCVHGESVTEIGMECDPLADYLLRFPNGYIREPLMRASTTHIIYVYIDFMAGAIDHFAIN